MATQQYSSESELVDVNKPHPAYRVFGLLVAIPQFFVLFIGGIEVGKLIGLPENLQTGASMLFALLCLLTPHYPAIAASLKNSKP
jgi:hypothetical protein